MAATPLRLEVILGAIDKATGPFKRIVGGSRATAKSLLENNQATKDLQRTQRDISAFHAMRTGLKAVSRELDGATSRAASTRAMVDNMGNANTELGAKLRMARESHRALTAEMAKSVAPSRSLHMAYSRQKAELAKLETEHAKSSKTLRAARGALKQADGDVAKFSRRQQELGQKIGAARAALEKAGISSDRFGAKQRELRHQVKSATTAISDQQKRLQQLAKAENTARAMHSGGMTATLHGAGMFYGGQRALGGIAGGMQPGMEQQASLRDISITAGFARDQEATLGLQIRKDALQYAQFTDTITAGLGVLSANGISAMEDLRYYSGLLAKTSVATGAGIEDLSNLTVSLQRNLGMDKSGMAGALDSLAYAGKQGSFEIRDMAKWMPQLSPLMSALGVNGRAAVDELGAALQVARLGAGSSDEAANNLRNYLSKITAPDTLDKFDKAGIDLRARLLDMQAKGITPLAGSLQLITEYMGKKGPEATKRFRNAMALQDDEQRRQALDRLAEAYALGDLFRDAQAMAFIRPAIANAGEMKSIQQGAAGASGGIDEDFAARMDTAQKRMDQLQIRWNEIRLQGFELLAPTIDLVTRAVGGLLDRISAWAAANPAAARGLAMLAVAGAAAVAVIGALLVVLGTSAMMIGQVMRAVTLLKGAGGLLGLAKVLSGTLVTAFMSVDRAILWVGRALLMNPLGLALTLIAGLAYLVWKNWDSIKPMLIKVWDSVVAGAMKAWEWLKSAVSVAVDGLKLIFIRLPLAMYQYGVDLIQGLINGVKSMDGAVKNAVVNAVSGAVDKFKAFLGIRSPSRVFAQFGIYTMQGLAGGLDRSSALPTRVLEHTAGAMRQVGAGMALGAAALPAAAIDAAPLPARAAAGGAPAADAGAVYHVHIHGGGGDARAIAEAVRAELQRIERERAARRRSGLIDYQD